MKIALPSSWAAWSRGLSPQRRALLLVALLLAAVAALQLGWLPMQRERADEQSAEATRAERQGRALLARRGDVAASAAPVETFRAGFPATADNPRRVRGLLEEAQRHTLAVQRADFNYSVDAVLGVGRYRVSLPVQGSYRALRQFIDAALAADPALVLDSLTIRRADVRAPQVAAELQFTLISRAEGWARATPPPAGAR